MTELLALAVKKGYGADADAFAAGYEASGRRDLTAADRAHISYPGPARLAFQVGWITAQEDRRKEKECDCSPYATSHSVACARYGSPSLPRWFTDPYSEAKDDAEWHRINAARGLTDPDGSLAELDAKYHDNLPEGTNCRLCGIEHAPVAGR